MIEFIADEDVPKPIVEKLRNENFEIYYIEEQNKGKTDKEVVEKAREIDLPILTFDSDFFKFKDHPGILHITQRTNYNIVVKAASDIINKLDKEEVEDTVIRINPNQYR